MECLFFKSPKDTAISYNGGIENPLPDVISKCHVFWSCKVQLDGCQEPLVIRMASKETTTTRGR